MRMKKASIFFKNLQELLKSGNEHVTIGNSETIKTKKRGHKE